MQIAIPQFDDLTALDAIGPWVVEQGRVITAAGVSSELDMALLLVGRASRRAVCRTLERAAGPKRAAAARTARRQQARIAVKTRGWKPFPIPPTGIQGEVLT